MKKLVICSPSFKKEGVFIKAGLFLTFFTLLFLGLSSPTFSQASPTILEIRFEGNHHIKDEKLQEVIYTNPGQTLSQEKIIKDMQALYNLGYFSKIRVVKEETPEGILLIYEIEENPVVSEIKIKGVTSSQEKKLKKIITVEKGKPWNYKKAQESEQKILEEMKKQGYTQAKVTFTYVALQEQTCLSVFNVNKGEKAKVIEVEISGNHFFSDPQIRSLMQTRFKKYFDLEVLKKDIKKIIEKYQNVGFYFVQIEDPRFEFFEKYRVRWVRIFLKINEGERFKMGKLNIEGNHIYSDPEIKARFRPKKGEIFDLSKLQESLKKIQDMYGAKGYLFAVVDNKLHFDGQKNLVDVSIFIQENNQVRIGKISVEGNKKTHWRVFKHTLLLKSGDIFDTQKLRESWRKLYNLGFFNKVEMEPRYTSNPSVLDLRINVEEREKAGKLLLGASYSANTGVEGFIRLSKDNLQGKGKMIEADWEFGENRNDYQVSYLDRWWADTPTRLELNAYNRESRFYPDEDEGYKKRKTGVEASLGRPWFSNFSVLLNLSTEKTKISAIEEYTFPADLSEGENYYQKLKPTLIWDSRFRDEAFNVYRGLYATVSVEKSGGFLGGNVDFTKYTAEARTYFRYGKLWRAPILALRIRGRLGENLPLDEKFYIGGQETLRGYRENQFRGSQVLLGTVEFRIPVSDNFLGYLFLDVGRVWEQTSMQDYKFGFGFGLRMNLPLGIIRLDYGIGEEKEPRFYFGMGDVF